MTTAKIADEASLPGFVHFDRASQLRARHGLKTPDALHLATALHYGCTEFWTNDDRLKKAAGGKSVDILSGDP